MKYRPLIFFLILCSVVFGISGCKKMNNEPRSNIYYGLFDSFAEISSYSDESEESFNNNCKAAKQALEHYNKLFDIYNEYDGINNLCTVNRQAGIQSVKVEKELIDFIEYSIDLSKKCNLEVNIAMGSVTKLWHDARTSANEKNQPYLPSKAELEEAYRHANIDSIVIDRENSTILISDPMTQIDVGAVAKGYAAMKTAELLRSRGADGYVLNLGGNLVTIGTKSNGEGWITGITNPDKNSANDFIAKIEISDISCVTSGDYERYFSFEGKEYHHIIDKDTLMPADHFRSVTVLCDDSALADALSTALFCMSLEDGKELLKSFANVEVIWILQDMSILKTDGVKLLAQ